MNEAWYRLAMILVATIGIWQGVMAIIFKLFTNKGPSVMTAVNYLPIPWCYLAAIGVIVATLVVLGVLDTLHKRALARS